MNDNPCRLLDLKRMMDQAKGEVERVDQSLLEESRRLNDRGRTSAAREIGDFEEKLRPFAERFEALGAKWKKLEMDFGELSPELEGFFQLITQRWKASHDRAPKEGLKVTFPNGYVVEGPIASATFAEAIERLSPGLIEYENFCLYEKPLVSRFRDEEHTMMIAGGWFLIVPSSTKEKAKTLQKLSRLLDARLKVEVVAGTFAKVNHKA